MCAQHLVVAIGALLVEGEGEELLAFEVFEERARVVARRQLVAQWTSEHGEHARVDQNVRTSSSSEANTLRVRYSRPRRDVLLTASISFRRSCGGFERAARW